MEAAALVPVRSFSTAKRRLAPHLSDADRRHLARTVAEGVIAAAGKLPAFVACDDDEVASWATSCGAEVLWGPGLGLNGAIDHGVGIIASRGFDHVMVAHGDLALPATLAAVPRPDEIVLVPDRRRDGTNVLSRPCAITFAASYGRGSFARHVEAALASGVPVRVIADAMLALDIDTIDDCHHPLVAPVLRAAGVLFDQPSIVEEPA